MTVNGVTNSASEGPVAPGPVGPGRVAVVTGAASGIGLGLSGRFAAEGMHVVMADVEEPALAKAAGEGDWVLGVNLEGVMNGVRAFMPVLLEQDAGHLVNTSSVFGVFAGTLGPYGVSKHAVAALTETLHFNLKSLGVTHVGVSVLC